jgi:fibronectin-binding autotransporter adhesin
MVLPLALGAGPAGAAEVYWDVNGGSPGQGGSGTWNQTAAQWNQSSDGVTGPFRAWDNVALDTAVFAGTSGSVAVSDVVNANGLSFSASGYALNGGTVTLGGASPTIAVNADSAEINSVIAGNTSVTKTGAGTLRMAGKNTYTQTLKVGAGALSVGADSALGASGAGVSMAAGTALDSANALAASRVITLESGMVSITGAGVGSAQFTGAGGLRASNGVTLNNDASNFTGGVVFAVNGDAYFTSVGDSGEASSLGADGDITFIATDQFSDRLNYIGGGETSNRNLKMSANGATSGALLMNKGAGTLTLTGDIASEITGDRSLNFSAQTGDLALLGTLSSTTDIPMYFTGGGIARSITLGPDNTYSGSTNIGFANTGVGVPVGTVTVRAHALADTGDAGSFGTGDEGGITIVNNSVVSYIGAGESSDRTWTIGMQGKGAGAGISNDGTGALELSGDIVFDKIDGNVLALGGSFEGVNTISGVMDGPGDLVMNGAAGSVWVLDGANTRAGSIDVESGTLRADSDAAFGATAQVTVNGGTLDLNGYDLQAQGLAGTGGTVALGSANLSINQLEASDTSYAGSITGGGGFTKLGSGTLTLTGSNTYTGSTTIGGGTLALDFSADGAPAQNIIAGASALTMAGGALLVTGAAGANNVQDFAGLNISGGNNTIGATPGSGGSLDIKLGAIEHSGGLIDFTRSGSGTINTTSSELGGWATVNGTDYAKIDENGNIVAFTDDDYTDQDNAASWQSGQYTTDVNGFFGQVGSTVQLAGLRYTAPVATTVAVADGQTLGVDGTIIVAPSVGANDQVIDGGSITGAAGGGVLGIQQNSEGTYAIRSQVVDHDGSVGFTKAGMGRVELANASNTYTGPTTIAQGTLSIANIGNGGEASAIGASTADASNLVILGSTLEYTGDTVTTDRGFLLGRSGAVESGTIDVVKADADLTFDGEVAGTDGAGLAKTGLGTLTLTNADNSYTGVTAVNGGVLSVTTLADGGDESSIGASSSDSVNLVLADGGVLQYTGGTTSTDRGFTLGAGGGGGMDVKNAGTVLTVGGTVVGDGSLAKVGAGTLVLSGSNTYTGGTVVSEGTLQAGSMAAFGGPPPAVMTVASGAKLDLDGFDNTVGALDGSGNVDLGSAMLTLDDSSGKFSGTISGTGGVTRTGAYTQSFLGANNTYTGPTVIDNSTLAVDSLADGGSPSGIGASTSDAANLVFINGTLNYTGDGVAIDRGFTLQKSAARITVTDATATLAFSGSAEGDGVLRKAGAGTLVMAGANTYTGGTSVDQGTLRAGTGNAFGTSAAAGGMALANIAGAVLDLDGFDTAVRHLDGGGADGGSIALGGATLYIRAGDNISTVVFSGAISGAGNLVKNGPAVQRLHGCNSSYTGSTTIKGGSIEASCLNDGNANSSIGAAGADAGNLVLDGGVLRYVGTGDSTDRRFTVGTAGGGLDASGTGALLFTSTAPVAFAVPDTATTLTLAGSSNDDNTLAALITDNGKGATSLVKTGEGAWKLSNPASTYTGVTTISGGVLAVDKLADGGLASSIGASTSDASNLVIGNDSTLRYTGKGDATDRLFTLQTGVTYIEASGTGPVVFKNTAPVTFAGSGARTVGLGGTNTGPNTLGGTIGDGAGGATTLAKNDAGTWVLTGDNSYTGSTVVNAGNLIVGNGGTTGNVGVGKVMVATTDATLTLDRSDTLRLAGTLSGPGKLAQAGTGTSVLTSADNAIGAASISAGTLQVDGSLTTSTIAMSGYSTLQVNGSVQAKDGAPGGFTGDAGASIINVNSGATLRANGDLGDGADFVAVQGMLGTGAGVLALGMGNDTLVLTDGARIAGGVQGGAGSDLLWISVASSLTLDGAAVSDFEGLEKQNIGTLALTGNHAYADGTTISDGTLQVGNGGTSGSLASDVLNNGALAFNRSDTYSFGGVISGSGVVNQIGGGTTVLTAGNSYSGATAIQSGTLLVNGNQSAATGVTSVASGATLGGVGTVGGNVAVADGGTLSPGVAAGLPGTFSINGDLELGDASKIDVNFGQANTVGGPLNDLINVGGNLTLDGALNVTETSGGTFGPGIYRVISYQGSLDDRNVTLSSPNFLLQTAVAHQVNLVNTAGETLNFWDGGAGPQSDGVVNGGDGAWRLSSEAFWTPDSGEMNGPYADGSFAVFTGANGIVNIDNSDGLVRASGMQFAVDGYTVTGGALTLAGGADSSSSAAARAQGAPLPSIIRVGDGTSEGAAMTASIDAVIAGNITLVKTDLGTLVLSGSNSYEGGTRIEGGTLSVSSDANLGAAAGKLTLDGGTLHTAASFDSERAIGLDSTGTFLTDDATALTLNGSLSGTGGFTKAGGGTLVMNRASSYSGPTTIAAGTLKAGAANVFSPGTNLSVLGGGQLDLAGFNQTVAALSNAGTVRLSSGQGATLTVNGNYAGNDGTLVLNSKLGGDDSPTDRLVVRGDTSGRTNLKINNAGGEGGPTVEGIKVVDVQGASNGSFSLQSDYVFKGEKAVVAGAYAYRLYKGGIGTPGDGDWYLRSSVTDSQSPFASAKDSPLYQAGVPVYEAYAGVLQSFNQLGTLQQRVGNRSWRNGSGPTAPAGGSVDDKGVWARVQGRHADFDPGVSTSNTDYDASIWKFQTGIDRTVHQSEAGRSVVGVYAQYGTVSSDIDSASGNGSIDTTGYGVGGTLTWYGQSGFYLDTQVQVTRYDSDLRSRTAGRRLADGNNGMGYALSVEGGRRVALNGDWSLTPQMQVSYSAVKFDDFTDPFGADVSLDRSNSVVGRLGVAIERQMESPDAKGRVSRSRVYGIANLYYDAANGSRVDVAGTRFKSRNDPLRGGIGLGWSMNSADDKYSVYAEALANTSLENFGKSSEVQGTVGVRIRW